MTALNQYIQHALAAAAKAKCDLKTLLEAFLRGSGYCDCWDNDGLLSVACMRGLCTHTQTYTYTYTYIYLYIYILSVACMRVLCTQYTGIYIYVLSRVYIFMYIGI